MTTIVASLQHMSADTFSHTDASGFYTQKVERIGTTLVGCAGETVWCNAFLRWRAQGGRPPTWRPHSHFEALVLDATGLFIFYSCVDQSRITTPFFAIGSGRQYALGAMAAGQTTEQAVEIACRFDPYSKPPVETFSLRGKHATHHRKKSAK